jgi:Hypoxia induced protein conserved region
MRQGDAFPSRRKRLKAAPQYRKLENRMGTALQVLIALVMGAVAISLLYGLRNMMKGGDANLSNKLMQLRILLQFIAVVLIVFAIYFFRPA